MPGAGTAVVDFGAFPGKADAAIAVTGQAGIGTSDKVEAWIRPSATAAHSVDEHIMAVSMMDAIAHSIVAGTGFTITVTVRDTGGGGAVDSQYRNVPRKHARMYGTFTLAWAWSS
jgi:hypothetical protein